MTNTFTATDVATELGRPLKRVRAILRSEYPNMPTLIDAARWEWENKGNTFARVVAIVKAHLRNA